MDTTTQSANRAYEDFEPDFQWERNERTATLIVLLPGFRREQLRVQITSTPVLKIIGEQPISEAENRWRRINKEIAIPSDCNADEVTAKFERGRLYVKLPIVIPQEAPPKANEASEEKRGTPQKKEEELPEEEGKREEKKKVRTRDGVVETAEATASKVDDEEKQLGAQQGLIKRTKTRVLDYTISLRPTTDYKNALGELKKPNKLMNSILAILFVVALGIYVKNAFKSFLGGSSKSQD